MPANKVCARQKGLKPNIGRIRRLILRWSYPITLLRYLFYLNVIDPAGDLPMLSVPTAALLALVRN